MGTGQRSNQVMIPGARIALDRFKYEVANELGIDQSPIQNGYWGYMTSRDCGAVGGHMVRRMIQAAEQALIQEAQAGAKSGFLQALNPNNPGFTQNTLNQSAQTWQQTNQPPTQ